MNLNLNPVDIGENFYIFGIFLQAVRERKLLDDPLIKTLWAGKYIFCHQFLSVKKLKDNSSVTCKVVYAPSFPLPFCFGLSGTRFSKLTA